jgi:hypothetical protein
MRHVSAEPFQQAMQLPCYQPSHAVQCCSRETLLCEAVARCDVATRMVADTAADPCHRLPTHPCAAPAHTHASWAWHMLLQLTVACGGGCSALGTKTASDCAPVTTSVRRLTRTSITRTQHFQRHRHQDSATIHQRVDDSRCMGKRYRDLADEPAAATSAPT